MLPSIDPYKYRSQEAFCRVNAFQNTLEMEFQLTHLQNLQGRILLEETYNALASAHGGAASILGTEAGVYVGCMYQEYADVLSRCGGKLNSASATGNSLSFMVGRHAAGFCLTFLYLVTATCFQ